MKDGLFESGAPVAHQTEKQESDKIPSVFDFSLSVRLDTPSREINRQSRCLQDVIISIICIKIISFPKHIMFEFTAYRVTTCASHHKLNCLTKA